MCVFDALYFLDVVKRSNLHTVSAHKPTLFYRRRSRRNPRVRMDGEVAEPQMHFKTLQQSKHDGIGNYWAAEPWMGIWISSNWH